MAKVKDKPAAPATLTLNLFSPGMSPLHRAGLGGLACTLKYIEQAYADDALDDGEVPGGPWQDGKPPWTVTAQSIELDFSRPDGAGAFLKRLFKIAFGLKGGLIHLPGQYGYPGQPNDAVRAEIQSAIQLTFLQHGPTCGSRTSSAIRTYEVDGKQLRIEHDVFTSYKLQGWYWLERNEKERVIDPVSGKTINRRTNRIRRTDNAFPAVTAGGTLSMAPHPIDSAIVPGAVVRHSSLAVTSITHSDSELICAHFSVIGCLALCINPVTSVLLIPAIVDLNEFATIRSLMTPTSVRDCRITSAGDAALQAQVRLRAKAAAQMSNLPGFHALTFRPTPWAGKLKSRVAAMYVPPGEEKQLKRFAIALSELPPRLVSKLTESFWVDSVVRPLVADNLAMNRPWYAGFARLMETVDRSNKVAFERKGLHAMIAKDAMCDPDGGAAMIQAIHEALRCRYGQIAEENRSSPTAMEKRWSGEYDRWRLAFAGAKTADQFRTALCDLFSRGGGNKVLRERWIELLPMLNRERWQLTRDLALLALPSYATSKE